MLLTIEVEVDITGTWRHFESKGYIIPKYVDANNSHRVKKGTKITVKTEDLSSNSSIKIKYACESCKEVFETKYSSFLKNKKGFCQKCNIKTLGSNKDSIKKRSGKNHPRYNELLTDEERERGRLYSEYPIWRIKVYEECEYTCQCCEDKTGGNLVAHHLNGWHWCTSERFSLFNGITLCEECHSRFHDSCGYENNTREQFLDFLISELQKRNLSEASKIFADF